MDYIVAIEQVRNLRDTISALREVEWPEPINEWEAGFRDGRSAVYELVDEWLTKILAGE